uniref:(northern house mosquito) hypothetical protein n=1 Tax=Culex pipiens TaxID=7175 RepID=A0A8D8D381_CULPI
MLFYTPSSRKTENTWLSNARQFPVPALSKKCLILEPKCFEKSKKLFRPNLNQLVCLIRKKSCKKLDEIDTSLRKFFPFPSPNKRPFHCFVDTAVMREKRKQRPGN